MNFQPTINKAKSSQPILLGIGFCLTGVFWGSSFLWIKLALRETDFLTLIAFRLAFGALGLTGLLFVFKKALPKDLKTWFHVLILSFLSPTLPFILITWAETIIHSGVAAIINGTVPLFTALIAHFVLIDEKMNRSKVIGFVIGFLGMIILLSKDLRWNRLQVSAVGNLAVVLASFCYSLGAVYSRRFFKDTHPLTQSTAVILSAAVCAWILFVSAWIQNGQLKLPRMPLTWFAMAWLGLFGTAGAFGIYFYLLRAWGAARTSLINYIFPVIGLVSGAYFLNEPVGWNLFIGSSLIIGGILVVNYKNVIAAFRPKFRAPT